MTQPNDREKFGNRWYDKDPFLVNAFKLLSLLDKKSLTLVSAQIIKEVQALRIRSGYKIETDRVLGMYKAENKRREADGKPSLKSATTALSTIPVRDCKIILECIFEVLKESREEARRRQEYWAKPHNYFDELYQSPFIDEEVIEHPRHIGEDPLY